ncbi:MAG: uroporphyrinogen decarboxylase family protein [Candidatus Ratteibacteria bacterium]
MDSRERVSMLLIKKELPDRMGIYEHFWPETLSNWVKEGYPTKKVYKKQGETRWDENTGRYINVEKEGEYIEPVNPLDYFDYDIVGCGGWFDTSLFPGRREIIEETDQWQIIKDSRGAILKWWKNKSGTPEHIDFEIKTPEIWKKYREILFETKIERLGDINQIKKNLENAKEKKKFSVYGNVFVFELLRATIGDQNFLPALLVEPEWIKDFCNLYTDFYIRHYEILFREAGIPDGFFLYEDFGYSKGLFCSPQTLKEVILPYERKLISFFKDYGLPVILHTDGDIRKAIPLFIEIGIDCIQPMEAKAGLDVVELAKEYGRKISYMGNINAVVLGKNDLNKVEQEVLTKIKNLKELKIPYFFHSDHSVPPTVNFKTYSYAVKIFKENSNY